MTDRKLSLRAYKTRADIQRILATASPDEAFDRVEDVVHDAFLELTIDVRRDLRREYPPD